VHGTGHGGKVQEGGTPIRVAQGSGHQHRPRFDIAGYCDSMPRC